MGVANTLPGLQVVSRSHTLRGVAPRDRLQVQVLLWLRLQALKQVRARTNSNKEQGAV